MKTILLILLLSSGSLAYAQDFTLTSPDGNLVLQVQVKDQISWSVAYKGTTTIPSVLIGMKQSGGRELGKNPALLDSNIRRRDAIIKPVISHKDAQIRDVYNELKLTFEDSYQLVFRAYDDGVAYRFLDQKEGARQVISEEMTMDFPQGSRSLFPQEESMYSHNERLYLDQSINEIAGGAFCSLPVLFYTPLGTKVLFTEAALHDYPGMFLRSDGQGKLTAQFPPYVLEAIPDTTSSPDRNQLITQEAEYIARIEGVRAYPWRVFIISDDDRSFVESNLVFQLSEPSVLENTSWIKPGKVAWDWYNANNIYGVDFKSGWNTATYKYYIDFAAAHQIEYVILDEGWTKSTTEILDFNPEMDVPELIRYGREKGVDIILWVLWKPLDENLSEILETYKKWGASGIKVDFMQRNDQYMVNSYERIAQECARLELLVDFHGAFKPAGLRRKYPNVLSYEGVKGSENNKWSAEVTPEHNVTIPFIRMAAGPMDYTPGAMVNKQADNFSISFERPMSLGTRAHQVAMYVVYESPLQMLCESPSRYDEERETVSFISRIPTTWDETVVLKGAVGDYIAVARRKGENWYIGAMTDWNPRTLELDFSFLPDGQYQMGVFKDGVNADRFAEDYALEENLINPDGELSIKLAPGGGWAAILTKQ